jgi:hypothetical protein
MKIVGRLLISIVGALSAAGMTVVGCGTTNNINAGGGTSGPGESCTRTFDCKANLVCEQNVCLAGPSMTTADGGAITVDGGDASVTTTTGPHLGQLNESCQTTLDCQSPFECIGQRCSVVNYGLTATGKTCAECNTAADCCELPVGFNPGFLEYDAPNVDGGFEILHELDSAYVRCQDLLTFIGGDATICSGAATFPPAEEDLATACFDYNTYCGSCGANGPWSCNAGACVYSAPCTASGTISAEFAAACPSQTRLGHGLSTVCSSPDGGATGSCTAGCALDSDCAGKVPSGSNHACSASDGGNGNCSCYQQSCYFTCSSDLDCAAGKSCDSTTHLCKTGACTTASDCIQQLGNPMAACMTGTCTIACTKDTDCSPPSSICSAGFCMASGCTSDIDCTSTTAHSFCVMAPAATTTYSSAVTN